MRVVMLFASIAMTLAIFVGVIVFFVEVVSSMQADIAPFGEEADE